MSELSKYELRSGWLGLPEPWHPLDLIGVAMGAAIIWSAVDRRAPRWVPIALGGVMVFIHSQRFFHAPQTRDGLMRLLQSLDVTPAELAELAPQLARQVVPMQ